MNVNNFNAICDKFDNNVSEIWEYIQRYDSDEYIYGEYDMYVKLFMMYRKKGWL